MAGLAPLSYPTAYAYAYAYTGRNAYAYTANHAYSAPDAYGFDAGNPMLAGALEAVRVDALRFGYPSDIGGTGDVGASRIWGGKDGLPAAANAEELNRCAAQPRMSALQLELMSGLGFGCTEGGFATLQVRAADGAMRSLLEIQRPTREQFKKQLADVDARIGDRDSRIREIVTQVAPPIAYFASVVNLQFGRHRRTVEFIDMALQFAYAVGQRFKLALACPRPTDHSSVLFPVIEVPQHASLPAGHAIESLVTAALLAELVPGVAGSVARDHLRSLAWRIADNRVVAGVHFPVDCLVGQLMGDVLAAYVLAKSGCEPAPFAGGRFDPSAGGAALRPDSHLRSAGGDASCTALPALSVTPSPLLVEQLARARAEWA